MYQRFHFSYHWLSAYSRDDIPTTLFTVTSLLSPTSDHLDVHIMSTASKSTPSLTFLGLDSSTQSLKASLLSSKLDIISELAVNFDADLPSYKTKGGVLHGPDGSGEVFSPVMMIVEAVDVLFERIKKAGWDLGSVRGVASAGQVCTSCCKRAVLIEATCVRLLDSRCLGHLEQSRPCQTSPQPARARLLPANRP